MSFLDSSYRRLGPRYPQAAVIAQQQLVYPVLLVMLGLLALYIDMSWGEYLGLALSACGGFFLYNVAYAATARRALASVRRWLEGERSDAATIEAWTACAGFPTG
jgi:hypothetical protein